MASNPAALLVTTIQLERERSDLEAEACPETVGRSRSNDLAIAA
jgi:hypothetical protein